MMAPAQPAGPAAGGFPSAGTLARLQAALTAYVRGSRSAAEERAVRDALAALADEAHARRLHGEQMLLAFKRVWHDLPEVADAPSRRHEQALLGPLVTLCIAVYYGKR
jgi:hypothetical protein